MLGDLYCDGKVTCGSNFKTACTFEFWGNQKGVLCSVVVSWSPLLPGFCSLWPWVCISETRISYQLLFLIFDVSPILQNFARHMLWCSQLKSTAGVYQQWTLYMHFFMLTLSCRCQSNMLATLPNLLSFGGTFLCINTKFANIFEIEVIICLKTMRQWNPSSFFYNTLVIDTLVFNRIKWNNMIKELFKNMMSIKS